MVSVNKLKELQFQSMQEYFEYVIASWLNGNKQQTRELFHELRQDTYVGEYMSQRECFFKYFEESMPYDVDTMEEKKKEFKKYV